MGLGLEDGEILPLKAIKTVTRTIVQKHDSPPMQSLSQRAKLKSFYSLDLRVHRAAEDFEPKSWLIFMSLKERHNPSY